MPETTGLSEAKRALLEKYLQGNTLRRSAESTGTIPRRTTGNTAPLSFAQQRLWFLEQLEPGSTAYIIPISRRVRGKIDVQVLERNLQDVVQRHEVLRTIFQLQDNQPVQVICAAQASHLPLIDLRRLALKERIHESRRLSRQEAQSPFDLARGPLLRAALVRMDTTEHVLLVTMHHIISDGWSNDVFFHELMTLYQAFAVGQPSPLSPLPIQYADFAIWQRQWLQGDILEAQMAYWKRQLADIPPLELPTDYPRPPVQSLQGASQLSWLPVSLHEKLSSLSQRTGVTLFMLLLTTFQLLLARYTGQTDISIGTPIANRTRRELEGLIGFFVNTLVLRTDLSGNPPFLEVLSRVREVVLGAHAHQDIPFEQLVEQLQPERDLSRSPLFQVMFSVQQTSVSTGGQKAGSSRSVGKQELIASSEVNTESTATRFDLEVHMMGGEQGLRCAAAYRTDLFTADTIRRILVHFRVLLESIVEQPHGKIAHLPLLTEEERQQLLLDWNRTQRAYPLPYSCVQLVTAQAKRTPQRVALSDEQTQLTYGALEQRANQLAYRLQELGVGPEVLVGLYIERSVEWVMAILATWKAGGAYIPLDPDWPEQRLTSILEQAAVRVVITQKDLPALPVAAPAAVVDLRHQYTPACERQEELTGTRWPQQLAYVIYTSGSTGRPKGAMLTQEGMLNHLWAKIETLVLDSQTRLAQTASSYFDISIWQCWAALLVGARVCIVPEAIAHDAVRLCRQIAVERLSILEIVPSLLRIMLDLDEQEAVAPEWGQSLSCLLVTGEALASEPALRWMERYPDMLLLNAYGPTECSDDVTHCWLTPDLLKGTTSAPIGQALANTQLYLLDDALELVPQGVLGQIYVGGIGVGRGYLADAAHTAEVFVPDLFSERAGSRLYKTGDLGCYRPDGQLVFVRRVDHQVKVRGYRIELKEIEAVLQQHSSVREAVVLVREGRPGDQQLMAYMVPKAGKALPAESELRNYLRERVPHYMLPSAFVVLEAMPLTATGKVDRRALPPAARGEREREPVGERRSVTPIEELLQAIWGEVLGRPQLDLQENFFEAGGHSLLATQLLSRVRTVLRAELPLRSLFEAPTIATLAQRIENALRDEVQRHAPPLVPVSHQQDLPLSFAQQRLWFLYQLEPESTAYLIPKVQRFYGTLDIGTLERSLAEIIRRHESLRTTFQVKDSWPVQVIHLAGPFLLPLVDLRGLEQQERTYQARKLAAQEVQQPCDLVQGPLLRTWLLRLETHEHVFLLTMHHIISDGWSMQLFYQELAMHYHAFASRQPSPLPPLPIQYADFALWQRQWLQGEVFQTQLAYWSKQLREVPTLKIPTDRPHPAVQSYHGASQHFTLSADLSNALFALMRQEGITLFMALLAAFQMLLHCYTGQDDIVVGTDVANRNRAEIEGLIGFFVNQLVLRTNMAGNPSFHEVLCRVREAALEAYTHQDFPFDRLVEVLKPERDLSRTPLFQVKFVLQNAPARRQPISTHLTAKSVAPEQKTAKFDLLLNMSESNRHLFGWLEYNTDIFDGDRITRMIGHFKFVLEQLVTSPDSRLNALEAALTTMIREEQSLREQELQQVSLQKLGRARRKRNQAMSPDFLRREKL